MLKKQEKERERRRRNDDRRQERNTIEKNDRSKILVNILVKENICKGMKTKHTTQM